MNTVRVTFRPDNVCIDVPINTSILEAARSAGIPIAAPCGGQGTCGRCRVLLPDRGSVLACKTLVTEETMVEIPVTARTDGARVHLAHREEPEALRGAVDPLVFGSQNESKDGLGLAVDLGTSTIAAELLDLGSGALLARGGKANSQAAFGAEVTRRMEHAADHGPGDLADAVLRDLDEMISELTGHADADPRRIRTIVIAGNAPMIHFLWKLDSSPILRAPHAPTARSPEPVPAGTLGIRATPNAMVFAFPWIGGWVGGDITAGVLATGTHRNERLTLLLDIGTNGEIVLGNRDWRMACAASAGPAFEGCGIRDGMSARDGAIDRVSVRPDGHVAVETIGGASPQGICGTGLISAVAGLFRAGILDRAGRIDPQRADRVHGEPAIILARAEPTAHARSIAIVQPDIDAVLRAKAALFAGITTLLSELDLACHEIDRWILAGGFGARLDPLDAITLGMIADVDPAAVEFAGNTALRGARRALLQRSQWEEAKVLAGSTTYVELIDQPGYFEAFTSARFLPHTDLALFPSLTPHRGTAHEGKDS